MKHYAILNNYELGSKLKCTPTDKIVSQQRLDSKKTKVVYENLDNFEIRYTNRYLGNKLKELKEI